MAIVCDLDGVIWLASAPIPGSAGAVARLRAGGHRVLFVSNNSASRVTEVEARLGSMGIPAEGDVITSSVAAASLVEPGTKVFMIGGPGLAEELDRRDAVLVPAEAADVVIVGRDTAFDFEMLDAASRAIRRGAHFMATNDDSTFPTPTGLEPGNGALVAAVATAAGRQPTVAGKPEAAMAAVVRSVLGDAEVVMVGDRPDTDGLFAGPLHGRFGLVLSGVTQRTDLPVTPAPDYVADDLAALADELLSASDPGAASNG